MKAEKVSCCSQEDSPVVLEARVHDNDLASRALEVSINIGLLILLTATCLLILRPFLTLIVWGVIIAVAAYPGYQKLKHVLDERGGLAAILCTIFLLALLIVPVGLLTSTLIEGIKSAAAHLQEGTFTIPPPPAKVETWPIIGAPLQSLWKQASVNLNTVLKMFAPQIKTIIPELLAASAGIGLTVLQFAFSILIAGGLLAYVQGGAEVSRSLANRLFGDKGPEYEELAASTIRSVTTGVLGVAVIQSIFAGIGFLAVGLPGAGLWALGFLIAAVLQVGAITLIPAVIYVFMIASSTKAVIFLIWCIIVALMDNLLKPLLLGRGAAVPIAVIFLGVIGGFMTMGIIGLFVGAVILSVGYKLFVAWLAPQTISG
jgi:predicted PurR-regulated permease PerM